jgi:asparagine synthetase B (glutamine-hydrolysing)
MLSEDGTLGLVFNGEIYNYPSLRWTLEAEGVAFRTRSATEVILHLYRKYGVECVSHLDGMFAVRDLGSIPAAGCCWPRDHMGQKPLFFVERGGALAFASEVEGGAGQRTGRAGARPRGALPPRGAHALPRDPQAPRRAPGGLRGRVRDPRALLEEMVRTSRFADAGVFDRRFMAGLLEEHVGGKRDHNFRLWVLLNLEIWHRQFIDGASRDEVQDWIQATRSRAAPPSRVSPPVGQAVA